jgi:tRNA(fMet)-specific endonuclease VapC
VTGRYLLDTSVVVEVFAGDAAVEAQLRSADELYLSAITLGELHYGAAYSARPEANAARIESFAETCTSVGVDAETAVHFGQLKAALRRSGRLIPENDLWIAACALRHDMVLATRDAHFAAIPRLVRADW